MEIEHRYLKSSNSRGPSFSDLIKPNQRAHLLVFDLTSSLLPRKICLDGKCSTRKGGIFKTKGCRTICSGKVRIVPSSEVCTCACWKDLSLFYCFKWNQCISKYSILIP